MWWFHGAWGWAALAMTLVMVSFWVILVWLFVESHQRGPWEASPRRRSPTAEQILGERFARGEIDEDEYRRRLDTLHGRRAMNSGAPSSRAPG